VWLPGGDFVMGSERFYPEEAPLRSARVGSLSIDETPVTNRAFAEFVAATGYRTTAETRVDAKAAAPGSLVFVAPAGACALDDPSAWWRFVAGACWHRPEGPGSHVEARPDHPVVHVSWLDAAAYADWAGRAMPSEAEWEYAARSGESGRDYAWGDALEPEGRPLANYWQGSFPYRNDVRDGYAGTSPVRAFPPNRFGLYDMIGNVWEWTADDWTESLSGRGRARKCCHGASDERRAKVLKGGSFLCAENYCRRYRPAARIAMDRSESSSHVGFRCVARDASAGVN
jgi:formylglycine-generating enzyme required for sulfatase activity